MTLSASFLVHSYKVEVKPCDISDQTIQVKASQTFKAIYGLNSSDVNL